MIRQRELPCGCEEIERNGEKSTLYTCEQHGGGPLSFGRAFTQEGLRTLDSMSQAIRAARSPVTFPTPRNFHAIAERIAGAADSSATPDQYMALAVELIQLGTPVTQRVTVEPDELKLLCTLVQCERMALLNERRAYVLARRGDTTRFQELIRQIDGKLFSVTRLGDKLSALRSTTP